MFLKSKMVKPVGFLSVFLMWWICIVFRHLENATVFDGKAFDSDGAGGMGGGWSKLNYLPYFHICAVCVNCDVILFNQSTRTQLKSIRSNVHFAECFYKMQFRWPFSLDMCGQKANEERISVFKNSYTPNSILRDKENWEWFPILSMYFVIRPLQSS